MNSSNLAIKLRNDAVEQQKNNLFLYEMSSRLIVNIIYDEIRNFWTNKKVIQTAISSINKYNVYDFIRTMILMSDNKDLFQELYKYITYNEVVQILNSLLLCAKVCQLENSIMYKQVHNLCSSISITHRSKKLTKEFLKTVNFKISKLVDAIAELLN